MGVHPRCIGHCAKVHCHERDLYFNSLFFFYSQTTPAPQRVLQTERDYVNTSGCMLSQIDSVNSTYGLGPMDKTCYPLHFAAARGSKPTVCFIFERTFGYSIAT